MNTLGNFVNWAATSTDLDKKIQNLKRKCDTLCSREADIITLVDHAESSSTQKRKKEVENWLENVERTRSSVDSLELQFSISGPLRLLRSKQLADHVEDLTKEVAELMEQGQFRQGLTLDAHEEFALPAPKLVGQAFKRNLKNILEQLRKDDVLTIGVWGMGGVGKTTLVEHIHNRIQKQSKTFGNVYWITVSQNPSIRKLQDDIAKAFYFDISFEDDERKRAAMLSRELMKRKRFVLILDDMWNDICLEMVGVPTTVNGCKILITTRSLEVCRRLCCQEKIKIEPLLEKEAWYLFEKTLRHPKMSLSPQVLDVAKCVALECAGLLLGIITLASCMREVNDVREWRSVLQALKESEDVLMEEKVFKVLKFSYNRLNDPVVQNCFLYCALYPEDSRIERDELIQYLIDERLIGKMRDRPAQFDRGHAILNKLINSCLLEAAKCYDVGGLEGVKMHDLVRDMAIKIMGSQFMIKAGIQLEEIPEEKEWSKEVERVSLTSNKIIKIASNTAPVCPKLLTLFLSGNNSLKRIGNSFFKHMPALQVLNLSNCGQIEELSGSISSLKSANALVLRFCSNLQRLPSLAELTSLKRLDLTFSGIREVPHGLERLVNLTYLDLSNAKNLKVFPSGILPKLCQLEYLKFDLCKVKIKGEEFKTLERLSTFRGRLVFDDNVNGFKEYVISRKQYVGNNCSYHFLLDDGDKSVEKTYDHWRSLNQVRLKKWSINKRTKEDVNVDVETIEALLRDVQSLEMKNCKDARSLSDVWWLDNATQDLKRCKIESCEVVECVGSFSSYSSSPHFFQTLEILNLFNLKNLHMLFEGVPSQPVFPCLKSITISSCNYMKKLFQSEFLPYLRNLEEIDVIHCAGLEEIITATPHSHSNIEYNLPKLKTLSLAYLPELKSICEATMTCNVLELIRAHHCPRLQRIPLTQPPPSLRSIKVHGENEQQLLESLECEMLPHQQGYLSSPRMLFK